MLIEVTLKDGSKIRPAFDPSGYDRIIDFYRSLKADGEIQDYQVLESGRA
jgi:hypothetical protein